MKLIKLFIILFPILILSEIRLNAQWVLLTKESELSVRKGLDAMYNLRYNEADSLFNKIIVQYPDNPVGNFLLGLVDWWRIATNFDVSSKVQRYSDTYYDKLNKSISLADSKLSNNPRDIVGLFFKGAALGYKARLKVSNFGSSKSLTDVISAAIEGQQPFKYYKNVRQ